MWVVDKTKLLIVYNKYHAYLVGRKEDRTKWLDHILNCEGRHLS